MHDPAARAAGRVALPHAAFLFAPALPDTAAGRSRQQKARSLPPGTFRSVELESGASGRGNVALGKGRYPFASGGMPPQPTLKTVGNAPSWAGTYLICAIKATIQDVCGNFTTLLRHQIIKVMTS